jgi:hypothetical protein
MSAQKFIDALNPFKTKGPVPQQDATPEHLYRYKNRWSLIGTVGSGKSTIAALLILAARTLSFQHRPFYCDVVENTSNIMEDVSNLQRGRFPKKTGAYNKYATESGLMLWWDEMWSGKSLHIPICDVAGEDLEIGHRGVALTPGPAAYTQAKILQEYVRESDGLILVAPASKGLLFKNDVQIEREEADIAFDPDVNLARIFGGIIDYKRTHQSSKPLKGLVIMVSKWDLMQPYADEMNMDILTQQGRERFLEVCFPFTKMKIKAMQRVFNTKVLFVPSFVEVERDGNGNIVFWDQETKKQPKIKVGDNRMPSYSAGWMADTINFLGQFAL